MLEHIKNSDIDYTDIAVYIPDVMNAMYNEHAASVISVNELRDAFRIKMMQSKAWLIQKFIEQNIDKNKTILVVGGWLGFTSWALFKNGYSNITEIDVDTRLHNFSKHLNRFNNSFNHIPVDVNDVDIKNYDVVINTSCEHILDNSWFVNIKHDAIMLLQSNNIDVPDHVNKCYTLAEMITKYPLELQYGGVLDYLDGTKRFMLIGKK
jgi:hypothetical protein